MAFAETTILSTREPCFGSRVLGQIIAVPSGRIDKVSLYLEPHISDLEAAEGIDIVVSLMAVDTFRLPVGSALDSVSMKLSDLKSRGFINFRLESNTESVACVTLKTNGGTWENHVAWRYVPTSSAGEELLISDNDGATWSQDTNRKFSFMAYSFITDAVDQDDQSIGILAGKSKAVIDDSALEFELAELTRATVVGDTVAIDFGNQVVTLVVDQSGSMTWNDKDGVRFEFLESYIDDLEASLPAGKEASYSIVKFNSRKVGSLDIFLQTEESGSFLQGIRIVRKIGSAPVTPSDGLVIFEGFTSSFRDSNLTEGTAYHYAAFTYDTSDNFSQPRRDSAIPQSPSTAPMGVASLIAEERIVLSGGGDDIGLREVDVSWKNPSGFDYDKVTVVRRTGRYPQFESDGTSFVFDPTVTTSFTDFDALSLDPEDHPINGLTYYYSIFSEDSTTGLKAYKSNARRSEVTISTVDRTWQFSEPPFNVPPAGFDATPPLDPTDVVATVGNRELLITWQAGDVDSRRYRIFYDKLDYPKQHTAENGTSEYSGEIIYDGTDTTFVHRSLENLEPNFYVIVAMDTVGNQSSGVSFTGTPKSDATDLIPPKEVNDFSVEVINSSTALLSWKIDIEKQSSVEAYFGDKVRLVTNLTFSDADPRRTTADLEFVEASRRIQIYNENGDPIDDDATNPAVDPQTSIIFDRAPNSTSNVLYADISMTPFTSVLNSIDNAKIETYSSLTVKKANTSEVITGINSNRVSVTFINPFNLNVKNDPPQSVPKRTWNPSCTEDNMPTYDTTSVPGVFVRSGDQFLVLIEASYRGQSLSQDLTFSVRILDKETGQISSRIRLPETGSDGVAILTTSKEIDDVLDRTGQPNGETIERDMLRFTLPAQDNPGQYIIEATGEYEGYSRTSRLEMSYEPSLNIDIKASPFTPNGVDVAEQQAFVYFGSFTDTDDKKTPVTDLIVTDWEIRKLSGGGPQKRPLFSRDSVPGTGVKAYTRAGIARMVYFGPGTDIEPPPPPQVTCTTGEIYELKVTASVSNMSAEGYAAIELLPYIPRDDKKIFLRLAKNQIDEKGNAYETGELARISTYADGSHESAWEIIARPDEDTETGTRSASSFRDNVVNYGGFVPNLKDGTVISIFVVGIGERGTANDVVIRTDLNPDGKTATAKATVINGKATFYLSSNMLVTGRISEPSPEGELGSKFYDSALLLWNKSPAVFAVIAHIVLEVNGQPAIFSGGGASVPEDALPAFLSLDEPLSEIEPKD